MFVYFELLNKLKRPADERETNIRPRSDVLLFTEGGRYPRLKEAKALLEELAS